MQRRRSTTRPQRPTRPEIAQDATEQPGWLQHLTNGDRMEPHGYFPNGNPDYETPWTRERNTGWIFLAIAITGTLIHHYWLEYDFILATAFSFYGLSIGLTRLGTQGRDQAETLQETEGQLDWAIKKLRSENLPIGPYDENQQGDRILYQTSTHLCELSFCAKPCEFTTICHKQIGRASCRERMK